MIAYEFLCRGRMAPFTGFQWPAAGCWVERDHWEEGSGVHACRLGDLPYWVGDELWRIELHGRILDRETQIEAARGRLVESIAGWDLSRFALACAFRTRDLALRALRGRDAADVETALLAAGDVTALLNAARTAPPLPGLAGEMVAYVADASVR